MSGRAVNLLPWRERRRQRCRHFWFSGIVLAGVVITGMTLGLQAVARFDRQMASLWLQSEAEVLASISSREPGFRALREQWIQQQARAQRQQVTREWQARLHSLAEQMPDDAWLTGLHFRQGRLELTGLTHTFAALSELELALKATHGFRLKQTGSTERDAQGRWQFRYELEREGGDDTRS